MSQLAVGSQPLGKVSRRVLKQVIGELLDAVPHCAPVLAPGRPEQTEATLGSWQWTMLAVRSHTARSGPVLSRAGFSGGSLRPGTRHRCLNPQCRSLGELTLEVVPISDHPYELPTVSSEFANEVRKDPRGLVAEDLAGRCSLRCIEIRRRVTCLRPPDDRRQVAHLENFDPAVFELIHRGNVAAEYGGTRPLQVERDVN